MKLSQQFIKMTSLAAVLMMAGCESLTVQGVLGVSKSLPVNTGSQVAQLPAGQYQVQAKLAGSTLEIKSNNGFAFKVKNLKKARDAQGRETFAAVAGSNGQAFSLSGVMESRSESSDGGISSESCVLHSRRVRVCDGRREFNSFDSQFSLNNLSNLVIPQAFARGERDNDRGGRDNDRGGRDNDRGSRDNDRGSRDNDRGNSDNIRDTIRDGLRDNDRGRGRDNDRRDNDSGRGRGGIDRGNDRNDNDRGRGRDNDRNNDRGNNDRGRGRDNDRGNDRGSNDRGRGRDNDRRDNDRSRDNDRRDRDHGRNDRNDRRDNDRRDNDRRDNDRRHDRDDHVHRPQPPVCYWEDESVYGSQTVRLSTTTTYARVKAVIQHGNSQAANFNSNWTVKDVSRHSSPVSSCH